jgi:hypothetical protein
METLKLLLTLTVMIAPNMVIMTTMGWTSAAHFAVIGGWGIVSTVLLFLIPERHRRPALRKRTLAGALIGCVVLAALVLGTSWNVRSVIASLLLLPGLSYLVLETVGLTPESVTPGAPLP